MSRKERIGRLEHAAASSPVRRAGPRDVEIGPLIDAAIADTRAGHGFPPDLDRVRGQFERDAMQQEGDRS